MDMCCEQPAVNWAANTESPTGFALTCSNCSQVWVPINQAVIIQNAPAAPMVAPLVGPPINIDPETLGNVRDIVDHILEEGIAGATTGLYQVAWDNFAEVAQTKASWGKKTIKTAMDECLVEAGQVEE